MSEHEEESKKKQEEPFIILGGESEKKPAAEHKQARHEPAKEHPSKSREGEYVVDLSFTKNLFDNGEIPAPVKKAAVYIILLIILLLSAQLRLTPINTYPPDAPLGSADNWWHYRHSEEIYEHGYPGTAIKTINGTARYWDYLHDAPEGGPAPVDFYHYFVAYSFKYAGKAFFPNLLQYIKFMPVLFGTLAALSMFLLVRELFGDKSALLASFLFALSAAFLQRSVVGQPDDDAIIIFFTIITVFLFLRAWKKKSFVWAGIAGVSLGLFGFTWPGGYTATAMILIAGAGIYYSLRLLEAAVFKNGPISQLKWPYLGVVALTLVAEFILLMKYGLARPLLYGGIFLFVLFAVIPLIILLTKDISKFKQLLREEWRGLAVFTIFLALGLGIVAITTGAVHANLFSSFQGFLTLRSVQRAPQGSGDIVRNVFLTVAEFNPASSRIIAFSAHIGAYILAILSAFALPLWAYKNIKEEKSHNALYFAPFILLWLGITFYTSLNAVRFIESFSIPLIIFASISIGTGDYLHVFNVKKSTQTIVTAFFVVLTIFILFMVPNISPYKGEQQIGAPYVQNSFGIAARSGGGEGANWLEFYKWARENTPEGTIFASWWDPGHGFTALAKRPTVADGSQNHKHVHDLALMFTLNNTGDPTLAVKLMKKYNITYFYTTTDLISKYGAISFLGTGNADGYQTLTADKSQVAQSSTGDLLIPYPFDLQTERGKVPTVILFNLKNNGTDADAAWKIADSGSRRIAHIYYFTPDNRLKIKESDPSNETIDISLIVLPGYGNAFFLQTPIAKNLLTRLHILEGQGLENYFEKVKDFNGEIKVFRVKYENLKE